MSELKPCPFCGGEVSIAFTGGNTVFWWTVTRATTVNSCNCGVFMESDPFYNQTSQENRLELKQKLIENWNRRVDNA